MNTKAFRFVVPIAAVALTIVAVACQNPVAAIQVAKGASASGATLQVSLRPISPVITNWLQAMAARRLLVAPSAAVGQGAAASAGARAASRAYLAARSAAAALFRSISAAPAGAASAARLATAPTQPAASRAYLAATRARFTLKNSSSGVVATWDISLGDEAVTASFTGDVTLTVPAQNVIAGNGYTLEAAIYNDSVSTTTAVVDGDSAPFDVAAGSTPVQVAITCLPVSATASPIDGTPANTTLTPWAVDGSWTVTQTGAEQWYTASLTAGTWDFSTTPGYSYTSGGPILLLFDAQGNFVDVLWSPPDNPAQENITTTSTYYVGMVDVLITPSDLSPQSVGISVQPAPPPTPSTPFVGPGEPNFDSATQPTQSMIQIVWTEHNSSAPIVGDSFIVLRDTDPSFSNPVDVTSLSNGSGTNSHSYDSKSEQYTFVDHTVPIGMTPYYKVAAVDPTTGLQSAFSPPSNTPPLPPTNIVFTNGASSNVHVAWDAVSGADAYYVDIIDASGARVVEGEGGIPTTNSIDFTGSFLAPGATYYFLVQSHIGGWGTWAISSAFVYTGSSP